MQQTVVPIVRLKPGMSIKELVRLSQVPISLDGLNDNSPVVIEVPVVVQYDDTAGQPRFPRTLMVWISQYGGVVTAFKFAPQDSLVNLSAAFRLLQQQLDVPGVAGWRADEDVVPHYGTLEASYRKRSINGLFSEAFGIWRKGSVQLSIALEEQTPNDGNGSPRPQEADFVLNFSFRDRALETRASDAVYARRLQLNGSEGKPLALSQWLSP